jgi:Tfp pilus assembly protein PilO
MFKNLNQAVPAANGLPFIVKPRPTFDQRSKNVTTALLSVAGVVFAVGAGLGYLLFSQIAIARNSVVNLQAQAGSSSQIARRYQSTLADYNTTTSQIAFLEGPIPQNQYVPTLLQQLQVLAQTTGLQVMSVKPGPLASLTQKAAAPVAAAVPASGDATAGAASASNAKAVAPPYDTLPVQLTVTGTYRQIMQFIYGLPRFPKILCLKSLNLSPKGLSAGSMGTGAVAEPALNAVFSIDAYVFAPPTTDTDGSATTGLASAAAPGSAKQG